MRICLVRMPSPFLIDEKAFPPLGIMAVGTSLKLRGHDIKICDGPIDSVPMDFSYYGVGPTIPEYPYAVKLRKIIKENNRLSKVVIGGPFATVNPERCLRDGFDCVVVGDGEIVSTRAFANGDRLIVAEERPLDDYPIIDRTLVNIRDYNYKINGRPATSLITSQGCPFKCAFCSKNYKTFRLKSAERVITEIEQLHKNFNYDALIFADDLFVIDRERALVIFKCLKEFDIKWKCLLRGDFVVRWGDKFVNIMSDSGCVEVGMGIESGSNRILSNINKGETVETIKDGIKILRSNGIKIKGFFIIGLPGETQDTLDETEKFVAEMNLDKVDIRMYQPYPGSPIWDDRESFDVEWNDTSLENKFYKGKPGESYSGIWTLGITNDSLLLRYRQLECAYGKN